MSGASPPLALTAPSISPAAHPAVDFIDNRLDHQFHPAFGRPDVVFNKELDQYIGKPDEDAIPEPPADPISTTGEMRQQQRTFVLAVEEYERKSKDRTRIDLRAYHDWPEVLDAVNVVREKYDGTNEKGFCRNLRHGFRSFANVQPAVKSWLQMLPKDHWQGSVLCGGLLIIFGAAARLGKMREDTYEALDRIPLTIHRAQSLIAIYGDSHKLEAHVSQVYVAILDILEHTVDWYTRNPVQKYLGAVLRGDEYGSKLEKKHLRLQKLEEGVEGQAVLNQHKRMGAIDQNVKYLVGATDRGQEQAMELQNMMLQMLNSQEKQNEILEYIAEQRRARQMEQERIDKGRARSMGNSLLLRRVLRYNSEIAFQDLEEILREGFTLPLNRQDRAAWVLQSERVRAWLITPGSAILHINGSEISHEPISSASLFCAILVQALLQSVKPAVTLRWFCGLHANDSASTLLTNLIGQILEEGEADLSRQRPTWFANINPDDSRQLCHVFKELLAQQLEISPVFIVIDGVSFYEDSERYFDIDATMSQISSLVEDRANILKLLITSPTRIEHIQDGAHRGEVLDVPTFIDGDHSGFNEAVLLTAMKESTTDFVEGTKELYEEEDIPRSRYGSDSSVYTLRGGS